MNASQLILALVNLPPDQEIKVCANVSSCYDGEEAYWEVELDIYNVINGNIHTEQINA